ncbi:MAG: hypothetical protein CL607_06425 [Anaerolineaceae bacterium]|nr:hypothetical protein [Anaerolineaceae bacterium]
MADKYTGADQDRRYTGEDVDITYNVQRCIHAAECVNRLSSVFDTQKRPWINADGAPADQIADTIQHCPSGALHYDPQDERLAEPTPDHNEALLWENGPIQVTGDLTIEGANVAIEHETRVTLCRCGASHNKPFCDNSHKDIDFVTEEIEPKQIKDVESGGKLTITANANGPLELSGNLKITGADGETLFQGSKTWLCRCGHSSSKPFCDGTHKKVNFTAE